LTKLDVDKAQDELVSSPDGTPSFITVEDRLRASMVSPGAAKFPFMHIGRDGGGTYSGHASAANSDAEDVYDRDEDDRNNDADNDEENPRKGLASRIARAKGAINGGTRNGSLAGRLDDGDKYANESGMGRGAHADRLGDAGSCSDPEDDANNSMDDLLTKADAEERSVQGSVY
jgi:hypothetical protein